MRPQDAQLTLSGEVSTPLAVPSSEFWEDGGANRLVQAVEVLLRRVACESDGQKTASAAGAELGVKYAFMQASSLQVQEGKDSRNRAV